MWVKVCGLRNRSTASRLASLSDGDRPDAVGLNFYSGSRRCSCRLSRFVIQPIMGLIVHEVFALRIVEAIFVDHEVLQDDALDEGCFDDA